MSNARTEPLLRAVRLLKAASKFRSNRERKSWRATHRIADKHTPRFVNTLLLEVRDTKKRISVARVSRAVATRNIKEIEAALLLPSLDENLKRKYRGQIRAALNEAGVANIKLQPKPLAATFGRFDLTNPRAVEWARQKSSTLVTEITEGTRRKIRTVIARGIEEGVPVRSTGRALRDTIGLTERQTGRVQTFRENRIKDGFSAVEADKATEAFATRLHRDRAETIARTETIDAAIQGRTELWDQATDRGLLERDKTKKKWIVTPDDRLDSVICAPMAGQIVGMDENFTTGDGRSIPKPTAHPRCRCDMIIVVPGTSLFA